ncbi:cytochrome P450 [Collybia nuda]|uniref:Cytochrome P450 n=1 Tax=Collybia nuda TaxID=64659 RepID=A0A9P5Y292_9AGAR|nr:cytochrome P450 [Collybia nuda]
MALHIEGNEVVLSILGSFILYLAFTFLSQRATSSLPGPSGWPIIGNLLDLNVEYLYATCDKWKKQYGDVFQLSVLGGTMVVIGSADAANELLERRGTKYSGRPDMPMITELMGWEWSFTFMPYGNRWREQRRLFVNNYHGGMIEHKVPAFEEVQKLLVSLLDSPESFSHHLKTYTAGLIIKRTYGYNVTSMNDPLLRLVDETNKTTSIAVTPGAFWVNLFPKMKYIPEWVLPGGGFKRQAREWRKLTDAMVEVPFQMVKEQVMKGTSSPSFVSKCLDLDSDPRRTSLTDKLIKETAAVAYAAGADTTFSVLASFVLAMTLYPEAQKRMQAEIDSVCSVERFPVFEDRPQLPYTDSVLVEVMRLTPPLPLAVPHRLDEADTFRGKYIPKGSVILANVWAILRDEEVFEDPSTFKPERYIDNPALRDKALNAIFGYGRRSCAGKGLALDTAWIAMVSIISAFDISKAVDKNGNEIDFEVKVLPGSASHVRPFPCKITPRFSSSMRMIKELAQELS